jgi:hypothetical protein
MRIFLFLFAALAAPLASAQVLSNHICRNFYCVRCPKRCNLSRISRRHLSCHRSHFGRRQCSVGSDLRFGQRSHTRSVYTVVTSNARSVYTVVTSAGGSVASGITSGVKSVYTVVTSRGGVW